MSTGLPSTWKYEDRGSHRSSEGRGCGTNEEGTEVDGMTKGDGKGVLVFPEHATDSSTGSSPRTWRGPTYTPEERGECKERKSIK